MAHKEIPTITAAAALDGTEQLHIVQGSNSRRVTAEQFREYAMALVPYLLPLGFTTAPTVNEVLMLHVFAQEIEFPDNFAGSVADVETAPTGGNVVLDVQKNGVSVGTVTIAQTTGVVTFATTGAEVTFAVGDVMKIEALSTDAALENVCVTFKGSRGG